MLPQLEHSKRMFEEGITGVSTWTQRHSYAAYDPGDGDLSWLRLLTCNHHYLKRLLTAAVLRSPFNVRPWIGIPPHTSTKAMGYFCWGHAKLHALAPAEAHREHAARCFRWLVENRAPHEGEFCWGNHFDFSTRAGTIPRHTPTIVWSSLIALALVEAYEVFGSSEYLAVAVSTAEWVKRLPRQATATGLCLSYVPFNQVSIHNSNMLGAALLARVAVHTKDTEAVQLARDAMVYSCSRQNSDGSWFYGEDPKYHWIDNFHTGYNLDCLKRYIDSTGDVDFETNLRSGHEFFASNFFEGDGRPKYYNDKTYPIDIQCAAQAIDTLAYASDGDDVRLALAVRVAEWTVRNMQADDGHFFYRDLGWRKVKTPMLHWGQATMFKALAHLLGKLGDG